MMEILVGPEHYLQVQRMKIYVNKVNSCQSRQSQGIMQIYLHQYQSCLQLHAGHYDDEVIEPAMLQPGKSGTLVLIKIGDMDMLLSNVI
jgi:hypothetical protein